MKEFEAGELRDRSKVLGWFIISEDETHVFQHQEDHLAAVQLLFLVGCRVRENQVIDVNTGDVRVYGTGNRD